MRLNVFLFSSIFGLYSFAQHPPKQIENLYESKINWGISDDFSTLDKNKWTYRRNDRIIGDSEKYVNIIDESYVSIMCDVSDKKGGGISGKQFARFGFYITKFRIRGIEENGEKSHTHPAIWAYRNNMGVENKTAPIDGNDWIEIDWVEYYAWSAKNCWDIDAPPNLNGKRYKNLKSVMLEHNQKTAFGIWEVVGLEYHPNYLQAWEYSDGKWRKLGKKIPAGNNQTRDMMKKSCFQNVYWILSNGYFGHKEGSNKNSWLDVDFFYHFPLK